MKEICKKIRTTSRRLRIKNEFNNRGEITILRNEKKENKSTI